MNDVHGKLAGSASALPFSLHDNGGFSDLQATLGLDRQMLIPN